MGFLRAAIVFLLGVGAMLGAYATGGLDYVAHRHPFRSRYGWERNTVLRISSDASGEDATCAPRYVVDNQSSRRIFVFSRPATLQTAHRSKTRHAAMTFAISPSACVTRAIPANDYVPDDNVRYGNAELRGRATAPRSRKAIRTRRTCRRPKSGPANKGLSIRSMPVGASISGVWTLRRGRQRGDGIGALRRDTCRHAATQRLRQRRRSLRQYKRFSGGHTRQPPRRRVDMRKLLALTGATFGLILSANLPAQAEETAETRGQLWPRSVAP